MIGKAVFWLGILVLLTPHEPDLGLGRPSAAFLKTSASNEGYAASQQKADFAANAWQAFLSFREDFLRRAPQMRAEIQYSLSHHYTKDDVTSGSDIYRHEVFAP